MPSVSLSGKGNARWVMPGMLGQLAITVEYGLPLVPALLLATAFHGATDAMAAGAEADQMSVPGQKDSAAWHRADTALEP